MIISTDTSKIKDANRFGELLREYFFTKNKGLGCYENFTLEPFMIPGAVTPYVKDFFGDPESWDNNARIHFYANQNNLTQWCAYMWDGDGALIVCDGERIAVNNDCKKDYKWKWFNSEPYVKMSERNKILRMEADIRGDISLMTD